MNEIVPALVVLIALGAPLLALVRAMGGQQASVLAAGVVAHAVSALAMVLIVREYYGYGDMLAYWRGGNRLASGYPFDWENVGNIALLILQRPNDLQVIGNGWSTGTMYGISCVLSWCFDGSLMAMCLCIALIGCASRLWLFSTLRPLLPERSATMLAVVCMLIPSVVFWTAGLLKEGIATPALAFATGAFFRYINGAMTAAWCLVIVLMSAIVIGLTKGYILFPLAMACVAALFARRGIRRDGVITIAPFRLVAGLAAAVVFGAVLGAVFPKYSLERFADTAEDLRQLGDTHAGGSTTTIAFGGNPLLVAATGLATALFRPLVVEVKNPLMLISSAEASIFLGLFVRIAFRHRWTVFVGLRRSWLFVFCLVFVFGFGVAVGMASTNLGTLARYRVPMLPFFGVLFVVLESIVARPAMRGVTGRRAAHPIRRSPPTRRATASSSR